MTVSTAFGIISYSASVGNFLYRRVQCLGKNRPSVSGILLVTPGLITDLMGLADPRGRLFSAENGQTADACCI